MLSNEIDHIKSCAKTSTTSQNTKILSSRLRILKQYQDSLSTEMNAWDELLQERKNKYNLARLEKQMISKGEKKITSSHRAQLPRLEEAWLRGLSDGRAEMSRLKNQETMVKLCRDNLSERLARKQTMLDNKDIELERTAKMVCQRASERLAGATASDINISNNEVPRLPSNSGKADTTIEESEFAKEVQRWMHEVQTVQTK